MVDKCHYWMMNHSSFAVWCSSCFILKDAQDMLMNSCSEMDVHRKILLSQSHHQSLMCCPPNSSFIIWLIWCWVWCLQLLVSASQFSWSVELLWVNLWQYCSMLFKPLTPMYKAVGPILIIHLSTADVWVQWLMILDLKCSDQLGFHLF